MFGYIKPCKPEMKVKEFDTFKAVYCGLCKELSYVYGPFASLTLSYDFTFIATVSLGLSESCSGFQKCSCVANPFRKKPCLRPCGDLTYCGAAAMLMIYYKLKDDIADSGFFRRMGCYLLLPFLSHARKKAARLYPDADQALSDFIRSQNELERNGCTSIDRAADPTANALAFLCRKLSADETQQKILNRFGYFVGRYVYFADALDDLEDDRKTGSYNPFLKHFEGDSKSLEEIREYAHQVLNLTVAEIAPAYELLELKRYKEILDNIIYLGFHNEIHSILCKTNQSEGKCGRKKRGPGKEESELLIS